MKIACYKCNTELQLDQASNISRSEECSKCYSNIRSCMMCTFYSTSSYNECKEPTADRILEKEKANFCDHYKLGFGHAPAGKVEENLSAANALFK